MNTTNAKAEELIDLLQHINLINIRVGHGDTWVATPVLYATDKTVDVLIDVGKGRYSFERGDSINFKFQKYGYEYVVEGIIADVSTCDPVTATIEFSSFNRYSNQRRHQRFDTSLRAVIKAENGLTDEVEIKNLSIGGAMVVTSVHIGINTILDIDIFLSSEDHFSVKAMVVRKEGHEGNLSNYGVKFIDQSFESQKVIACQIGEYEKQYLSRLKEYREFTNKAKSYKDTSIAIFSQSIDDSNDIKESLVKLGAENFSVFYNLKFYLDYFEEQRPMVAILDIDEFNSEAGEFIQDICQNFCDIRLVVMLPIEYSQDQGAESGLRIPTNTIVEVMYKPLIFDEFEKKMLEIL